MNKIKLKLSNKILDIVECLPKFEKGYIAELQRIRCTQNNTSDLYLKKRTKPDNSSIDLSQINITLAFKREDFHILIKGLKGYFKDADSMDLISLMEKDKNYLLQSSTYVFKAIHKADPDHHVITDSSLPGCVNSVSISICKLTPSLLFVLFEFGIEDSASDVLRKIQEKKYLPIVRFNSFWPFKYLEGHSSSTVGYVSYMLIKKEKDKIREVLESWVENNFYTNFLRKKHIKYTDGYVIHGIPHEKDKRKEWMEEYSAWLLEYGIDSNNSGNYLGDDFLFSKIDHSFDEEASSCIFASYDSNNRKYIECASMAVAVEASIRLYTSSVELLSSEWIYNTDKNPKPKLRDKDRLHAQKLNMALMSVKRINNEIEQFSQVISQFFSELGGMELFFRKEKINLGDQIVSDAKTHLNYIHDSVKIIDDSLTNYISIQNIGAMYKLQNRIYWLTAVVTVITIYGMANSEELEPYLSPVYAYIKSLFI